MRRKIMKLGPSTMVVSIPSKWIHSTGIKQGQEIELTEKNNELIISSTKGNKSKKETTIEITQDNSQDIEIILTHLYRQGFDKLLVKNVEKQIEEKIKEVVNKLLLGFEITSKDKNIWIIENIASPAEEKYEVLLKRSFFIVKETIKATEEYIKNKTKTNIEELKSEQDKYILYCQRSLTLESTKNPTAEWELLTFLRHIEHSIYYLNKELEKGFEKDNNLIQLVQKLEEYFNMYFDAYTLKDIKSIHTINRLKSKYQFGECIHLIEKGKNAVIYSYLREIFRVIQIGSSPIFRLILEIPGS